MIAIPLQCSQTHFDLFIIWERDNLDRLRTHDPNIIEVFKMPEPFCNLRIRCIRQTFGNKDEIRKLAETKDMKQLIDQLANLERGWKLRPELGDGQEPFSNVRDN